MTDTTKCPACDAPRIGYGTSSAFEYQAGFWMGSTTLRALRQAPEGAA